VTVSFLADDRENNEQVFVERRPAAVKSTLRAFAATPLLLSASGCSWCRQLPTRRPAANPQATAAAVDRRGRQTDGQTDGLSTVT